MNWEGTKRVAFVPVDRGRFNDFPPPPNWEQEIEERISANDLNSFDNMDCSCGTHPTAYTKAQIGWLDPSLIVLDSLPDETFDLYSAGLVLPPPSGRTAAVQIQSSGNPLFVESRQRLDQDDGGHGPTGQNDDWGNSTGIASEGVIVSELAGVENPTTPFPGEIDPLIRLHTQQALLPGQKWTSPSGIVVSVTDALVGGFRVTIQNPETTVAVPGVIGMPPTAASHTITQAGLVPKFTPPTGVWVNSQSPVAGHQAARGSTVTMHLASHGEPP